MTQVRHSDSKSQPRAKTGDFDDSIQEVDQESGEQRTVDQFCLNHAQDASQISEDLVNDDEVPVFKARPWWACLAGGSKV